MISSEQDKEVSLITGLTGSGDLPISQEFFLLIRRGTEQTQEVSRECYYCQFLNNVESPLKMTSSSADS